MWILLRFHEIFFRECPIHKLNLKKYILKKSGWILFRNLFHPIVSVLSQCFYWLKINSEGVFRLLWILLCFHEFFIAEIHGYYADRTVHMLNLKKIFGENSGFSIKIDLNPLWQCFWGLKIHSEVEFLVSFILLCFNEIYFWLIRTPITINLNTYLLKTGVDAPSKLTSINCVSVFDGTEN